MTEEDEQDTKDGRALRKLREALPPGYGVHVLDRTDAPAYVHRVVVWVTDEAHGSGSPAEGVAGASTIEQAADACREAIGDQ
jgi:hypothetical protein